MRIPEDIGRATRQQLEVWSRSRCQSVACGGSTVLCRVLGEFLFYVGMRDLSVAPHLAINGYWESWITQFVARTVQPGQFVADVGANLGYFTVILRSLVGAEGRVVAYEPNPVLAGLLTRTLAINGMTDVELQRTACSDQTATGTLRVPGDYWGSAYLSSNGLEGTDVTFDVPTARLDACHDAPDFVKIDAEGAEPAIWRGMRKWPEPPAGMLVEWAPARYADAAGLLTELEQHYGLAVVRDDGTAAPTTRDHLLGISGQDFEMAWLHRAKS